MKSPIAYIFALSLLGAGLLPGRVCLADTELDQGRCVTRIKAALTSKVLDPAAAQVQRFSDDRHELGTVQATKNLFLRLVSNPRSDEAEPPSRWFGLLSPAEKEHYGWKSLAHPLNTANYTLQYPVRKLSRYVYGGSEGQEYLFAPFRLAYSKLDRAIFGTQRTSNRFIRHAVIGTAVSVVTFEVVDHGVDFLKNRDVDKRILKDPDYKDIRDALARHSITKDQARRAAKDLYSVLNDFRFNDIRTDLRDQNLTTADAVEAAEVRVKALEDYEQKVASWKKTNTPPDLTENLKLVGLEPGNNNPTKPPTLDLFKHLIPLLTGDYQKPEYHLLIDPAQIGKNLTDDQAQSIFDLEHARYELFGEVTKWFGTKPNLGDLATDPDKKAIYEGILRENYTQRLLALRSEKKITSDQMVYWMMADVDTQIRVKQLLVAGARPRATDGQNILDRPIDLSEIQGQLLDQALTALGTKKNNGASP
jgi:hypothetical protein